MITNEELAHYKMALEIYKLRSTAREIYVYKTLSPDIVTIYNFTMNKNIQRRIFSIEEKCRVCSSVSTIARTLAENVYRVSILDSTHMTLFAHSTAWSMSVPNAYHGYGLHEIHLGEHLEDRELRSMYLYIKHMLGIEHIAGTFGLDVSTMEAMLAIEYVL